MAELVIKMLFFLFSKWWLYILFSKKRCHLFNRFTNISKCSIRIIRIINMKKTLFSCRFIFIVSSFSNSVVNGLHCIYSGFFNFSKPFNCLLVQCISVINTSVDKTLYKGMFVYVLFNFSHKDFCNHSI